MSKTKDEMKTDFLTEAHDKFIMEVVLPEVSQELLRSKMGRPSIPEEKKREKNILKVYVNDEEKEQIREFVGDRSTSDVVRSLILDAIKKAK